MITTYRATKNFVSRHRVGIAVVVTAVVCIKINREAIRQYEEFLKDHGLYEAFYNEEF